MRVVEVIPHPVFTVTLFNTEMNWIVQLEAGPMAQSYKFSKDLYENTALMKQGLNERFYDKAHDLFNEMFLNRKALIDEI